MGRVVSFRNRLERYEALRVISTLCFGLGVVLLLIATGLLLFGLYNLAVTAPAPTPVDRMAAAFNAQPQPPASGLELFRGAAAVVLFAWSVGAAVGGLEFLAAGSLIRLFIHVEENTRVSAQCLDRMVSRLDAAERPDMPEFLA